MFMNRALTREINKVKRSAAFKPIVESTAARTLQVLMFHAAYNKPRLLPRFIWVEIVAYVFKRAQKDGTEQESSDAGQPTK
jgi:hypothetical protein